MITSLFFTVLGYAVLEACNFFCPPKHRRSEKLLLTAALLMGALTFLLAACWYDPSLSPSQFAESFSELDWTHVKVLSKALGASLVIALVCRTLLFPAVRMMMNKLSARPYFGELLVWESVVDDITRGGRWVHVITKDNKVYEGLVRRAPSVPGDRDIYLNLNARGKFDTKGRLTFNEVERDRERWLMIPGVEIVRIEVIENEKVATAPSRFESLLNGLAYLRKIVRPRRHRGLHHADPAPSTETVPPPPGEGPVMQVTVPLQLDFSNALSSLTVDFEDLKKRVSSLEGSLTELSQEFQVSASRTGSKWGPDATAPSTKALASGAMSSSIVLSPHSDEGAQQRKSKDLDGKCSL